MQQTKRAWSAFIRHILQLVEKLADIALILCFTGIRKPVIGIAGRINAGSAAKGINLESGVVSHADETGIVSHGAGLDESVFGEGRAVFRDFPDAGKSVESKHFHTHFGERLGQLADFSLVPGRQDHLQFFPRHIYPPHKHCRTPGANTVPAKAHARKDAGRLASPLLPLWGLGCYRHGENSTRPVRIPCGGVLWIYSSVLTSHPRPASQCLTSSPRLA